MSDFAATLLKLAAESGPLLYVFVYAAALALANVASFTIFWLGFHHAFGTHPLWLVFGILLLANATGNIFWFSMGYFSRKSGRGEYLFRKMPKREEIEGALRKRPGLWIILAEFILYSTFPILFLAGRSGVPYRKFLPFTFLAVGLSLFLFGSLTYILGRTADMVAAAARIERLETVFGLGLLGFLVLTLAIKKLVAVTVEKDALEEPEDEGLH